MYDTVASLQAIDGNWQPIMACLSLTVAFAFLYLVIAVRMAIRQRVYVVPFIGASVFFWHDLTFVLMYDKWFNVYNHWWFKMWWFALVGTCLLEAFQIYQVIRYGHRELWPNLSRRAFTALVLAGTLGVGAMWALVKGAMNDEFFFITFLITAVWSVPFHTALLSRRKSRAGQSVVMELSVIVMLLSLTAAFAQVDPYFRSPVLLAFVACFALWPLVNVWLILRHPAVDGAAPAGAVSADAVAAGAA